MRRFLIWLSGARKDVLARSTGDRAKYEGVGGAILITAALAGVSMTFALNTVLNVYLVVALLAGVAWSLAIMSLDRWMVVSIQRREKPWQNFYTAVPRLLLAILFGLVISTPLVLQIFRPEIEAQMVEMRQHDADTFRQQQQTGSVGKSVAGLTSQRDALQKIISSGGDTPQNPEADPKIIGLRQQLAVAQAANDKAYKEWQCQLYGPCKPTGPGPLANADEQAYKSAHKQVDTINNQIQQRTTQLTANDSASRDQRVGDARVQLPQVQSQLSSFQRQQQSLQQSFDAKNRSSSGLLMRLKALDQVSAHNDTLSTARLLLFLLITSIECLPILVKLLLTFGPENNYERILKLQEKLEYETASLNIRTRKVRADDGAQQVLNEIWGDPVAESPGGTRRLDQDGDSDRGRPSTPAPPPYADPYAFDNTQLQDMSDEQPPGFDDFDMPHMNDDRSHAGGNGRRASANGHSSANGHGSPNGHATAGERRAGVEPEPEEILDFDDEL